MKAKKYQLKNGLRVLLLESHKSPVVSIQMWVKTGSADEKKKQEGISHFIEHLVFKGTRKFKVGEIAQSIEGAGGELNAYTSFDQTVFYVTISKEFADTGLLAISEMMGFPTFDQNEVNNEREVVIEEIKRGEDSPERKASQALFRTVYKKHPYGVPVIGYSENIKQVSVRTLEKYFKSRYVPKNMFLVISGDFKSIEMQKKVTQFFSEFKPYKLNSVKRAAEPKQTKARIHVQKTEFKKTSLFMAWRSPEIKHKDIPALDVMSLILGQGDSSRLSIRLRLENPIVQGVGASTLTLQDPGLLTVSMNLEPKSIQKALDITLDEIINMIKFGPTAEEMQKAVNNLASEQVYSVETVDGIARKAGSLEFYTGDFNYFPKYLKQIYSLKPEDISKVAKKYFKHETLSLVLQTDQDEEQAEEILKKFVSEFKLRLSSKEITTNKPKIKFKLQKLKFSASKESKNIQNEIWTHKSGIKVVLRHQPENPTISLRAGYLGGSRLDPISSGGQTELLSRIWTSGSKNYSESEINHVVDFTAAGISAFGGRNTIGLTAEMLSSFSKEIFSIAKDLLLHPNFSAEHLEREKYIMLQQIKHKKDNPASICMLQFIDKMFANHPYGRDPLGSEQSLEKISSENLQDYFKTINSNNNLTLVVVGNYKKEEVLKFIDEIASQNKKHSFTPPDFPLPALNENQEVTSHMKKEQAHLCVGYRSYDLHNPKKYALEIIQSILSGQGGRLFIELRDKNSLAYSVSPIRMEGLGGGYFGGYIGCSPEKTEKALSMMTKEFEKLAEIKISAQELERAQKYLIGRHNIDLQRKSSIAQGLLLDTMYGVDQNELFNVTEKYLAVNQQDVLAVAKEIFSGPRVVSLVTP